MKKDQPKTEKRKRRGQRSAAGNSAGARANASAAVGFALPRDLDMRAARPLKHSLDALYAARRPCVIDAAGVSAVSTGSVQILVAFFRAMTAAAIGVTLARPSPAMSEALHRLGLAAIFELSPTER